MPFFIAESNHDFEYTPILYQPKLKKVKATNSNIDTLTKWTLLCYERSDKEEFGKNYNILLQEYKPIIDWAFLSWDYLLSTQGFRYLRRLGLDLYYSHGDYRAFTQSDYKKLLNRCFKNLLLTYTPNGSFTEYLRTNFFKSVIKEYRRLRYPKDAK